MSPYTDIKDTHVLVAGSDNSIGKALVKNFLCQGAKVSYCAPHVDRKQFDDYIKSVSGSGAHFKATGTHVKYDNLDNVKSWMCIARHEYGRIGTVVVNISHSTSQSKKIEWEHLSKDIMGLVNICTAAVEAIEHGKPLSLSRAPSIILVAPDLLADHVSGTSIYAPIKAFQQRHAMTRAASLGRRGIRVNIVSVGVIQTSEYLRQERADARRMQDIRRKIPMVTLGDSQDVANAVLFLASASAKFINGANIVVDGGMKALAEN